VFLDTNNFDGTPLSNFGLIFKIILYIIGFYVFLVFLSVILRLRKHIINKKLNNNISDEVKKKKDLKNNNSKKDVKKESILNSFVKKGNKNYKVSLIKKDDGYAIEDFKREKKKHNFKNGLKKLKQNILNFTNKFYEKCIKNTIRVIKNNLDFLIKKLKDIYRKIFNYLKKQIPYMIDVIRKKSDKLIKDLKKLINEKIKKKR
jgi:hypothetical protein